MATEQATPLQDITESELRAVVEQYFDQGDQEHAWPEGMPLEERAETVADWLLEAVRIRRAAR